MTLTTAEERYWYKFSFAHIKINVYSDLQGDYKMFHTFCCKFGNLAKYVRSNVPQHDVVTGLEQDTEVILFM